MQVDSREYQSRLRAERFQQGEQSIQAFVAFLGKFAPAERKDDRRFVLAYKADHAPESERIAALVAWAQAEETVLGDPRAAAEVYRQHARWGQAGFTYYVPEDGVHATLEPVGDINAPAGWARRRPRTAQQRRNARVSA